LKNSKFKKIIKVKGCNKLTYTEIVVHNVSNLAMKHELVTALYTPETERSYLNRKGSENMI